MPLGRAFTYIIFMPEESLPPEAQKEASPQNSALKPTGRDEKPAAKKRKAQGSKKTVAKKAEKLGAKTADTDQPKENKSDTAKTASKSESTKPARRGRGRQGKPQADGPKVKLDGKTVAKRAWKIFLGEVGEEGLALIGDKDARELARRSLKIAEIYSQEEAAICKKSKGGEAK